MDESAVRDLSRKLLDGTVTTMPQLRRAVPGGTVTSTLRELAEAGAAPTVPHLVAAENAAIMTPFVSSPLPVVPEDTDEDDEVAAVASLPTTILNTPLVPAISAFVTKLDPTTLQMLVMGVVGVLAWRAASGAITLGFQVVLVCVAVWAWRQHSLVVPVNKAV